MEIETTAGCSFFFEQSFKGLAEAYDWPSEQSTPAAAVEANARHSERRVRSGGLDLSAVEVTTPFAVPAPSAEHESSGPPGNQSFLRPRWRRRQTVATEIVSAIALASDS